jgi:hypothetical protein
MEQVRLSKIALVGVGALGSLVGELLVRGGAEDMLLLDDDVLIAGNLVRHRLRLDALGEPKATALADDWNLSSPHARVRALAEKLPWDPESAQEKLADRRIIIECTGEDGPLETLARSVWTEPKLFFSISVGRESRRLYVFSAHGTSFPREAYHAQISPWLLEDWRDVDARDLPWEGAGCWHPIWPARLDDLMLMAATAAKLLEREIAAPTGSPRLQVFEQRTGTNESFEGLRRVMEPGQKERHAA